MKNKMVFLSVTLVVLGISGTMLFLHRKAESGKIEEQFDGYVQSAAQGVAEEEDFSGKEEYGDLHINNEGYMYEIEKPTDISTLAEKGIDYLMDISQNTAARAYEFNYLYDGTIEINPELFSESITMVYPRDPTCYEVMLSVLSQYADANDKGYGVFEIDGFYKSEWEEDGICGYKIEDSSTGETIYFAYADTGFDVVGYIYKVE